MSEPSKQISLFSDLFRSELKQIVREVITENGANSTTAEKWFYNSREAAALIGIPKSWLESAAKRGEIKRIRFGHYKVFEREELQRFADECRKKSAAMQKKD